jgi:PAS domain S-box-containing protein
MGFYRIGKRVERIMAAKDESRADRPAADRDSGPGIPEISPGDRDPGSGAVSGILESRRRNRRFKYLVVAGAAGVLGVILAISLKIYAEARWDIEEQFNRQQLLIADQVSGRITSFLDELNAGLRYSAQFLRTVDPGHAGRMVSISGLFERLGGRLRVNEVGYLHKDPSAGDPGLREYSKLIMSCLPKAYSCFRISRKSGKPDYLFGAAPVGNGDWIFAKVTIGDLDRAFVSPVQSGLKGRAWLMDGSGRILISPGFRMFEGVRLAQIADREPDARLGGIAERMLRGERGFDWHHDFRPGKTGLKRRSLTAFSPLVVGRERWSLAVTASSSEVGDLVRRTFRKSFLLTSLGFIVIISAALLILDRERRRIRVEDRLQWSGQVLESKTRLQALFDGITDSICILDKDFKILVVNREMARLLGRDFPDLIHRPWGGESETPIPEDLADRSLAARTFENGRRGVAERSAEMPGGDRLDLELYTYPIFGAKNEVEQVILYIKDVTERRALELQILRQDRLSIVGKMSAQVAHEIRNPLSAINLNAELLGDELGAFGEKETAEAWVLLRSIRQEVDNLRQVTDDYLKFVRMPRSERRVGDLNEVLDELLNFYAEEGTSRNIEVVRDYSPDLPAAEFDETQMRLAFQNLILNAFDAMPGGGRLTVRTRTSPNGGIGIDVEDQGVGISAKDQESMFTPFFTTKANGTGLGLVLTLQILSEHRGTIRFSSQENMGTTFHIELPAAAAEAAKA